MITPEELTRSAIPKAICDRAGEHHLAVMVADRCLIAATCDLDSAQINWHWSLESTHQEDPESWLSQIRFKNWNQQVFRKVSILFPAEACTVIPSGFYHPDRSDEVLSVLFRQQVPSETRGLELPPYGARLIYRVPSIFQSYTELFPQASVIPTLFPFLMRPSSSPDGTQVHLDVSSGYMMLRIVRDNRLLFSNFFRFHSDEDVLYYLSNSCMNLDVRLAETTIHLSGGRPGDSTRELLGRYCQLREYTPSVKTTEEMSDIPSGFTHLAQSFLCA